MKMRKLGAVVLTIAIVVSMLLSFSIVSQAATVPAESQNAKIYVSSVVVEDGYWEVNYGFDYGEDLSMTLLSRKYNGIAICGIEMALNILASEDPVYEGSVNSTDSALGKGSDDSGYWKCSWVQVGSGAAAKAITQNPIITLVTNYEEADKTESEITEMFSDLRKTVIKMVYCNDYASNASGYTNDMMVSYGVGNDGITKNADADYVLLTPASSGNDDPVDDNAIEATTTIAGAGSDTAFLGKSGGEYGSAFRIAFTRPEAATDDSAIFGLTVGETKKYSPKQVDILKGLSGAIVLDVSFLNGSTEKGKAGTIAPAAFTAASIILSDGAGKFFYSDETDANKKAE